MDERQQAIERLMLNARERSERHLDETSQWSGLVRARFEDTGGSAVLPGYIPYIGTDFFAPRTKGRRILIFAMSQNLHQDDTWVREWASDWHNGDGHLALDRQNKGYESEDRWTAMHPFDTGHIPILSGLLRALVSSAPNASAESIYDEIAATNLSKFSFRKNGAKLTAERLESHQRCWEWFSKEELRVLRPDYVICLGNLVYSVLKERIREVAHGGQRGHQALHVAFPSLQVINSRWPRSADQSLRPHALEMLRGCLSAVDLELQVDGKYKPKLVDILERDWYYFWSMKCRMEKSLDA